ncbi:hypothetical protein RhiirA4_503012 [Rhizophagus irregularis]|uniref:Uncharacterized protein n=1 Tax=Rhizophagus irregularis TaxID=588596 RepID=A0A2I1H7Y9_9GLOM|nr:hypothetical protein RhiirA4_503012 [Rhizophagus irregularis]
MLPKLLYMLLLNHLQYFRFSTSEYIEFEKTVMKQDALLKPGKIPIRLHKPESKVIPAVYFTAVFLIKRSGEALRNLLEDTLFSVKLAEQDSERIKIENEIVLANCAAMTNKMNDMEKEKGDRELTSGLMIADLENRIRNLEADITAKERIILEKNETINSLWEKINAQEEKVVTSTCNMTNMDVDNNLQKKKKRRNKKRKRTRVQYDKNGTINELKLGLIRDADKDRLEEHFAEKSRDITFYDIPAYWSDREIFAKLHDNVGFVEYMRSKRCYKYKTVRATLHFSKEYEKIYKEGGVNVSLTRNNRLKKYSYKLSAN